jgi:hypothetical protein
MIRAWSHYLSGWSDAILWTFVGLMVAAVLFGLWKYKHDQRRLATNAPARAAS